LCDCGGSVSEAEHQPPLHHRHRPTSSLSLLTHPADLRKLYSIPDTHAVLFAQGGGTTQFASVFLNLVAARRLAVEAEGKAYAPPAVDYVVTGSWSSKAYAEAQRLSIPTEAGGKPFAEPRIAATAKPAKFTTLPAQSEYNFSPDAAYVYYCENETIHGVEFPADAADPLAFPFDKVPAGVPIVADYSSSFVSRPIPHIEKHALIYAGAQKNLGPSGATVVIVRKDLLVDTTAAMRLGGIPPVPIQSEYKTLADNGSLYNTPPTFPIYVSALVLKHLLNQRGGIAGVEAENRAKAEALYASLEAAEAKGAIRCVVREKSARSWMNVTFEIAGGDDKEKAFLAGAEQRGFRQLKGHRSVGGIRASIYNAVSLESVKLLAAYIDEFAASA
jgi:phosphoserine aminotransferase